MHRRAAKVPHQPIQLRTACCRQILDLCPRNHGVGDDSCVSSIAGRMGFEQLGPLSGLVTCRATNRSTAILKLPHFSSRGSGNAIVSNSSLSRPTSWPERSEHRHLKPKDTEKSQYLSRARGSTVRDPETIACARRSISHFLASFLALEDHSFVQPATFSPFLAQSETISLMLPNWGAKPVDWGDRAGMKSCLATVVSAAKGTSRAEDFDRRTLSDGNQGFGPARGPISQCM